MPVALLAAYGLLRFSTTLFGELRDVVFVRVTQHAIRQVALNVFRHLHALSLRFHLERQTGGMTRDIERGTRGISTLLSYLLFSIIPVILEFALVAAVLLGKFDWRFAAVTFGAVAVYIAFTITVTEWRIDIRRRANELDSKANTRAIDSLLNYETVKYFGNEEFEARRYDENLRKYEDAAVRIESSLGLLNIGQSLVIAAAVTALMFLAADGVAVGRAHAGRPGAGQRPADPALHPAQLPRHGVPRDQAVAAGHGHACSGCWARTARSTTGPARPSCRRARRRSSSGTWTFSTRRKRQILSRRQLRHSRRAARRGGRAPRLGQVDAGAAAVPLLRRVRRRNPGERHRTSKT